MLNGSMQEKERTGVKRGKERGVDNLISVPNRRGGLRAGAGASPEPLPRASGQGVTRGKMHQQKPKVSKRDEPHALSKMGQLQPRDGKVQVRGQCFWKGNKNSPECTKSRGGGRKRKRNFGGKLRTP